MKKISCLMLLLILSVIGLAQSGQKEHDLLVMPTAFTLNQGEAYFTDYELIVLNFGMALTPSTHISALSLFPITSDMLESFSVGIKQNLVNQNNFGVALFGSYTPKYKGYTAGGVASIVFNPRVSLHVGIGLMGDTDTQGTETLYMGGIKFETSKRTALIVEYTNFETAAENDFKGMINIGFRFRGKRIMFDFGGFRPLESTNNLILFPFLKATVIFGRK